MKKLILISVIALGCSKNATVVKPDCSLTGVWKTNEPYYAKLNLSFKNDTMTAYGQSLRYLKTDDTIYKFRPEPSVIEPVFTYTVIAADTIRFRPAYDLTPSAIFYRD